MHRVPLVVFSHLRWDFVYQRPQHLISRIARHRPVLFVEEPEIRDGAAELKITPAAPGVRVCRPQLDVGGPGFNALQQALIDPLLRAWLGHEGWNEFAVWLYTPMAARLAQSLGPCAVLYDCMDELSAFLGAPPELIERERDLMAWVDVVFTGGPSLYESKKDRHPFVRCFPSSVEVEHFADPDVAEPADQASLVHPRFGYFGVVDERIDRDALDALAQEFPSASVIVVGPVVKIDPASLPRRANLHYPGGRPYAELPGYVRHWDVCTMPFVIGPATRYISPTKVLEYMAAGRPIASTPIADVVNPYGDIVHIGEGPEGFVAACRRALEQSDAEREARNDLAQQVLRRTSWDETARRMEGILDAVVAAGRRRERTGFAAGARA